MNYQEKYMKYKHKYTVLKKSMSGGSLSRKIILYNLRKVAGQKVIKNRFHFIPTDPKNPWMGYENNWPYNEKIRLSYTNSDNEWRLLIDNEVAGTFIPNKEIKTFTEFPSDPTITWVLQDTDGNNYDVSIHELTVRDIMEVPISKETKQFGDPYFKTPFVEDGVLYYRTFKENIEKHL